MRNLALKNLLIISLFAIFSSSKIFSQDIKTVVVQDPKFEQLLKEKQAINNTIAIDDNYKIQIYYGTSDEAKKKLIEFNYDFKEIGGIMTYSNPTYKVWVGNFKLRIEAEKALLDIKKKYTNAFLIKPSIK